MAKNVTITIGGATDTSFTNAFGSAIDTVNQLDRVLKQVDKTGKLMQRTLGTGMSQTLQTMAQVGFVGAQAFSSINRAVHARLGAGVGPALAAGLAPDLFRMAVGELRKFAGALAQVTPYILALAVGGVVKNELELWADALNAQALAGAQQIKAQEGLAKALFRRITEEEILGRLTADQAAKLRVDVIRAQAAQPGQAITNLAAIRSANFPATLSAEDSLRLERENLDLERERADLHTKDLEGTSQRASILRKMLIDQEALLVKQRLLNEYLAQVSKSPSVDAEEKSLKLRQDRLRVERELVALDKELAAGQQKELDRQLRLTQGNWRLSEAEKFKRQRSALEAGDRAGVPGAQDDMAMMGPDPASYYEQMSAVFVQIQNEVGTVAQTIARTFHSIVQSAIDGVAAGIAGLIQGTLTWGNALRQIGTSIMNGIINAIARMFAEWIVGRLAVKAVEVASSAAEAAAKAPAALLTSISSMGTASIIGLVLFIAALGVGIAAAAGAFAEGGYTGPGSKYQPAGIVHRGEFVMPAQAVNRIGVSNLDAMAFGGGNAASGERPVFKVALVRSQTEAQEFLESREGQAMILSMVAKNIHRFT